MAQYNFPQIAALWIAKNNPSGVAEVLTANRLIANTSIGARMSSENLASVLYMYYLKNGGTPYANLLRQIPVNENISQTEIAILENASNDIKNVLNIGTRDSGGITTQDVQSSVKKWWDLIVGGSETVTPPTVTTTTKTSPLTVGLIIGGVAVLAIIAYVVIKL